MNSTYFTVPQSDARRLATGYAILGENRVPLDPAATSVFLALAPGDHVVAPTVMYWALRNWLLEDATHWGLEIDLVDTSDPRVRGRFKRLMAERKEPRETLFKRLQLDAVELSGGADYAQALQKFFRIRAKRAAG